MAGWNASAMRGHGEAVTIRMVHDNRQYRMPGRHADDGADGGGGESVEQELLHDVSVAVAERLQDAGIDFIHAVALGSQAFAPPID